MAPSASVFGRRFRQARLRAALTQEEVAVRAGIDEFSASARISQYETGKHVPRFEIAANLAGALSVPVEFFYAVEDQTAELLLVWHGLSESQRAETITTLQHMTLCKSA